MGRRLRGKELPSGAEEAHQAALFRSPEGPCRVTEDKEPFLARWSRLKREAPQKDAPAQNDAAAAAPTVPPVESLTPESDFAPFMHPKVGDELRRLALKKLFSDPHFNVPDPFEPFSGDWTGGEALSPELLATLNQARTVLFTEPEKKPATEPQASKDDSQPADETGEEKQDESRRQDA
ncbi:MAG: DUF3306 domain-containing protein [Burkholderiales bacterium]